MGLQIIQFPDGAYGIRKRTFTGYLRYLDLGNETYWWAISNSEYGKSKDFNRVCEIWSRAKEAGKLKNRFKAWLKNRQEEKSKKERPLKTHEIVALKLKGE